MKKVILTLLALGTATLGAQTGGFSGASQSARADLDRALRELAALDTQIANEKIPLANQLLALETEVLAKREDAQERRRLLDTSQYTLEELTKRVQSLTDNNNYLANLMRDYLNRFESFIHLSELQIYHDQIAKVRSLAESQEATSLEKFRAQLVILDASLARLSRIIGGTTFQGEAVDNNNVIHAGTFTMVGPFVYFASSDGTLLGEAIMQRNEGGLLPVIYTPSSGNLEGAAELARSGSGTVPMDVTLGDARRIDLTREGLIEHLVKGGAVMIPILGLFFAAVLIAIYKFFEIGGVKRAREEDVSAILDLLGKGQQDQALAYARKVGGPVGEMLTQAVTYFEYDKEVIEESIYEVIIKTQPRLERFLPFIAVVAATAPLLGLLGTVTGMIKTFRLITVFGTGDAQQLSSGISEALITTKYGLYVAIPTLILHGILSRKAKSVVGSMEQIAVGFLNGVTDLRTRSEPNQENN